MTTLDLRGRELSTAELLALVPRSTSDVGSAVDAVAAIIAAIPSWLFRKTNV